VCAPPCTCCCHHARRPSAVLSSDVDVAVISKGPPTHAHPHTHRYTHTHTAFFCAPLTASVNPRDKLHYNHAATIQSRLNQSHLTSNPVSGRADLCITLSLRSTRSAGCTSFARRTSTFRLHASNSTQTARRVPDKEFQVIGPANAKTRHA